MLILGIESSCDETAFALLEMSDSNPPRILGELISSQTEIHRPYGGVVPELASRAHLQNLPLLYEQLLQETKVSLKDIDRIGVTQGPGLKGCLLMGVHFAKGLSAASGVPLYGVNHIEGHVLAPLMDNPELTFPFLCLVVSGGHTEIHEVHDVGDYRLVARTSDDAAGEAFDKSAALLGVPYPGGPRLAHVADSFVGKPQFSLPKVMREAEGFSFSGLKTAIALLVKKEKESLVGNRERVAELCAAIQDSIIDALCFKLEQARIRIGIERVAVTGGVSANKSLRERVSQLGFSRSYFPSRDHCMDNGAMIAFVAGLTASKQEQTQLDVYPRWPIEHRRSEAQV